MNKVLLLLLLLLLLLFLLSLLLLGPFCSLEILITLLIQILKGGGWGLGIIHTFLSLLRWGDPRSLKGGGCMPACI